MEVVRQDTDRNVANKLKQKHLSKGALLSLANIFILIITIFQTLAIEKGGSGVPLVLICLALIVLVSTVGLILAIRDLKNGLRFAKLGIFLHSINVLVFLAIIVLSILNVFY